MSSDLTFLTNEAGNTLRERFFALLGSPSTRLFDCLVGYFFISGFYKLYPALKETEKIRVLIGLKTDSKTFEFLQQSKEQPPLSLFSHAEVKEAIPNEVLAEIDAADDTPDIEEGIQTFIQWCRSGKLEIKVYPSSKIHAKLYIFTFVDNHFDTGRV